MARHLIANQAGRKPLCGFESHPELHIPKEMECGPCQRRIACDEDRSRRFRYAQGTSSLRCHPKINLDYGGALNASASGRCVLSEQNNSWLLGAICYTARVSYCRMSDDSDVYLIGTTVGTAAVWECVCCGLSERIEDPDFDPKLKSREAAIDHLNAHVRKGDRVPPYAFERLRAEIAEVRERHGMGGRPVTSTHLDRVGMAASTLCAVHCAVLPFVLGLLPLIGMGFMAHSWFEWGMVGLAATIGTVSLFRGHRIHRRHTAWCFFLPGLAFVLAGLLFFTCACAVHPHHVYGWNPQTMERVIIRTVYPPQSFPWRAIVMAVGGFSIAAAHFVNMRLCRSCHKCADESHHRGVV
jgi:hypothetical protein